MKAAPFDYLRPESLPEALATLADHGDGARPLAGGQSLLPLLATRLARPAVVVDIARLDALGGCGEEEDGRVRLGALLRHRDLERDEDLRRLSPLLSLAAAHVAHPGIRNRGTLGGSLALGDPAAEYPAVALALGASVRLASAGGEREVAAEDFFEAPMTTAAREDELVTALLLPPPASGDRFGFCEIAERRGDYALAGIAVARRAADGAVRAALFGAADRPLLLTSVAAVLAAPPPWDEERLAAAADAARADLDGEDVAPLKRHLAGVAVARTAADLSRSYVPESA